MMLSRGQCVKQFLAAAALALSGAAAGDNLAYAGAEVDDRSPLSAVTYDRLAPATFSGTALERFQSENQTALGGSLVNVQGVEEGIAPSRSGIIPVDSYFDDMATDSTEPLGIIWVLAIDVSGSISSERGEYDAQLDLFADAIERDDFRESIFGPGGPGSAGIVVVDYDTRSELQIGGVDFRENDRERFREFADRIRNLPRRASGGTHHDAALENAAVFFDMANQRGWTSDRRHVLVMTDGTGRAQQNYYYRRLLAQRHEAIVSSLVITPRWGQDVFEHTKETLTTPAYSFLRRDGNFLDGGFTEEIATAVDINDQVNRFRDRTFMVMRRQITMHTAGLDFDDSRGTRFASVEPASTRPLAFMK